MEQSSVTGDLLAPPPEARDLASAVRGQLGGWAGPDAARRAVDGEHPSGHWDDVVAAGFLDVGLPADVGGEGSVVDLVVLLEEAGRALVGDGLTAACASLQAQAAVGLLESDGPRRRTAVGVGPGGLQGGLASGSGTALDGIDAEMLVLALQDAAATSVVLVDATGPGVTRRPAGRDLDPSRPALSWTLDAVSPVGVGDPAAVGRALALSRLCFAADLTGVAAAALDRAVEHAQQRRQFGRTLSSFQAVKHRLADLYVGVEKARSLVLGAAAGLATSHDDATSPTLMAWAASVEAALASSTAYVQLLGAMGVTFEADAHLYLRRAHQTRLGHEPVRVAHAEIARRARIALQSQETR